jgi:hypothetical protein
LFLPGHIHTKTLNKGNEEAKIERKIWIEDLKNANRKLEKVVTNIEELDPDALVIIMAYHVGYVGQKEFINT